MVSGVLGIVLTAPRRHQNMVISITTVIKLVIVIAMIELMFNVGIVCASLQITPTTAMMLKSESIATTVISV